jgi:hypothetical protein
MAKKPNTAAHRSEVYATFSLKSGVGKTTVIRCAADLLDATGSPWSGVSVDRSERLPNRYPGKFTCVQLPTDRDGRLDPYSRTRSFAPLDGEIERMATKGSALLLDIGSGEYPGAVLEHAARTRLGTLLTRLKVSVTAFVVTTADAVIMADTPRLIEAIRDVLPAARIVIVLNQRVGAFRFAKGSEAEKVWERDVAPLTTSHPVVNIPAMPPGTWDPYEDQGLRFGDVALLDLQAGADAEKQLIAWAREPRSLAVARQGDVAEWLHGAWSALTPIVQPDTNEGAEHAR